MAFRRRVDRLLSVANVAYLIASHTNPEQVTRLISRIRAERPTAPIVLHHDEAVSSFPRTSLDEDEWLHFIRPSIHGEWGSFDFVAIALAGIDEILRWQVPFDYLAFISGQDYPITNLHRFEDSLVKDGAIVSNDTRSKSLDRYRYTYYRLPRRLETRNVHRAFFVLQTLCRIQPFLRFTTGRVGCRVGFRRSRFPRVDGLTVRKGFTWWTLSRDAVSYIHHFVRQRKRFVDFFRRRVLLPDEAFFQTILTNTEMSFMPDDGRFIKWHFEDAMNPEILKTSDADDLIASDKFFARKFDTRVDATILDILDDYNHIAPLPRRGNGLYA